VFDGVEATNIALLEEPAELHRLLCPGGRFWKSLHKAAQILRGV